MTGRVCGTRLAGKKPTSALWPTQIGANLLDESGGER